MYRSPFHVYIYLRTFEEEEVASNWFKRGALQTPPPTTLTRTVTVDLLRSFSAEWISVALTGGHSASDPGPWPEMTATEMTGRRTEEFRIIIIIIERS